MSEHYRETIRKAVVDMLKGVTDAGDKVFPMRVLPIQSLEELPCIIVYTTSESSKQSGDGLYWHRVTGLTIEGAISGDEATIDGKMDSLVKQVEDSIKSDLRVNYLLSENLVLKNTATEVDVQGLDMFAGFKLDFEAVWLDSLEVDEPVVRPSKVYTIPSVTPVDVRFVPGELTPLPDSDCGPDGCDLSAWGGEADQ